ncbi:MAG: M48 family metallopeptidase, partial [Rhizobiales bacterium]|nr:M48 family metallopeptidase [Hyphomicrobiales bacterium]
MQTEGTFFDGETAANRAVTVRIENEGLAISGATVPWQGWRFHELAAIDPPHANRPFRLTNMRHPGMRLILTDPAFIAGLLDRAPQLRGGFNPRRAGKAALWIGGGLAALVLTTYLVLQFAPQKLAFLLPDDWRDKIGAQIENSLTGGAKLCDTASGRNALAAMAARLADGNPDMPPITVKVYNIPIMNAFAMPGGRIVITGELLRKAQAPEDVAGVLAHELGHVVNRHSEAQLIRATGLQLLIGIATGGGDTVSSLAGVATILRYSRQAEAEADGFALKALENAAIDPLGLKRFFELVLKEQGKAWTGAFGKIEGA